MTHYSLTKVKDGEAKHKTFATKQELDNEYIRLTTKYQAKQTYQTPGMAGVYGLFKGATGKNKDGKKVQLEYSEVQQDFKC